MGIYRRIVQWLYGRTRRSTGAKNGHTHTRVIGWTGYGKGHAPKDGHKPITIIDQP